MDIPVSVFPMTGWLGARSESGRTPAGSVPELSGKCTTPLQPMLLAAGLCALMTLPVAWMMRQTIYTDGLAYLEIANNAATSSPRYLISNAYWSPGYPALIAATIKLFHPLPSSQSAAVHALDWVICSGVYLSFTFFLHTLLKWVENTHGAVFENRILFVSIVALAYALLFFSNIHVQLWVGHPDLLVEALVYLIAGLCIRLSLPDSRLSHYVVLGLILALAYTAKAAMFLLSIILLILLFIWPPLVTKGRRGALVAAASFLIVSLPLIAALSYSKGRITFGDAGKLNYAWLVNDVPFSIFWESSLPHSPGKIASDPVIVKLEGPIRGTWPLWYDPSYWYEGVQAHFDLRQQVAAYLGFLGLAHQQQGAVNVKELAQEWIPLFAGAVTFVFMGARIKKAYRSTARHLWLFLWPAAAFVMYASVHLEYRFVVPFFMLGWVGFFVTACIVAKSPEKSAPVILVVVITLLMIDGRSFLAFLKPGASRTGVVDIAAGLGRLGIRRGDELVTIGAPGIPPAYYSAWLIGARYTYIVAGDPDRMFKRPASDVRAVIEVLRSNGAKAIVSRARPAFEFDSGWVESTQGIYVRLLQ
jgi:hypothetical protein